MIDSAYIFTQLSLTLLLLCYPYYVMAWLQQKLMRSVSIVYHKQREQPPPRLTHTNSLVKRSVDEYYIKLMEKERQREKMQQGQIRGKVKTSKSNRNSLDYNVVGLNIVQIAIRQQQQRRYEQHKDNPIIRKINSSKMVLKGLNLPHTLHSFEDQDQPFKHTHAKLRNLHRGKLNDEVKDTIIVMSANLVVDEHCFWQSGQVEQQSFRFWKILQSHATVVWVCEKEQSYKKLIAYSRQNKLRLDGVYVVVGRKNRRGLSVSYSSIENDYGVKFHQLGSPLVVRDQRKMIAIQGLAVEQGRMLEWDCFYHALPIIRNYRSVVHYIRIDMSDRARLNSVIKALSQQTPPKILNILPLLQKYEQRISTQYQQPSCSCKSKWGKVQPSLLLNMQQIKTKMIRYFTQSLSLNLSDRILYDQSENSLQFIIGDILRRNYRIFQNYYEYIHQYKGFKEHMKAHSKEVGQEKGKESTLRYRNKIYLWEF